MKYIYNRDGKIIRRSRNLRGIRTYVSTHLIKYLDISCVGRNHDEGLLSILFENGDNYQTHFGSYSILRDWVRKWKNVYGSPLTINGHQCGEVDKDNFYLSANAEGE